MTPESSKAVHHRPTGRAPGPRGTLVWGSLDDFRQDAIGFMQEAVRQYGDVVRLRFGPVVAHLVNDPAMIEQVLLRGGAHYDKRTRSVSRLRATCGDSLLSSDGPAWLRHRRLIQGVFQPRYLESLDQTIDDEVDVMLARWSSRQARRESIDIVSEMIQVTVSIAAKILFGAELRDDAEKIEASLAVILQDTWRRLEAPFDPGRLWARLHRQPFRAAVQEIDRIVYRLISQRQENFGTDGEHDDLLSRLLRAHDAESETRFSDQELRDACVTLLLAGHETTANALAWSFYLVALSPQEQHERSDLGRVFAETIRLYPSIWIMERRVVESHSLGPFQIERGTTLLISPFLVHRHPEYWTEPECFLPSRFDLAGAGTQRPKGAYIPFGLGPHRCIGEHMATKVATRILSKVFRRFRLSLVPGQSAKMFPGITLRHADALWMNLQGAIGE